MNVKLLKNLYWTIWTILTVILIVWVNKQTVLGILYVIAYGISCTIGSASLVVIAYEGDKDDR